ncbi:hypothetical protein M409DRAFT_26796 [Zasmidium cellare ATCC 36951]|uniref:Uncharacterized protein n=1 Tax=Zasmidium cellare ATCC 36951 TaxID=1080233 RepID=A0A6A6C7W6_ZASCE|nr:uncharacterized protein M409DRAFT_26796 [Zasmidium cellare ATCC 36951]KAF2162943.1 hypothetical protein M409DRAFT_26796 [Zasmidium cellare ATCC 36951]
MGATSAASGPQPTIIVGVILGLAMIFIAFCIGLYKYLEKRRTLRAVVKQDVEAQEQQTQNQPAWREVFLLSKVRPGALLTRNKQTGTPRDGEVSIVVLDSSTQAHTAVPAIPSQPQPGPQTRMQTIPE